ncbi:hypothetical protein LMH87_005285 [Akanthomyces muscarius]|uniref:Uncharacterized protein n=1 Tax=Akanthomyces muscarius TaxID=2231603 RepID=A0A9W8QNG4_AKAMU|nr:hypothetical protein LMH87_005285 [Akanthomyces muscarius]KAJ4163564.1 hypothetical protein LMH87_005285 [Akanthomyces muscarius]
MVSTANLVYHDLFISTYKFRAKRPVMNHGYLEATDSPKFRLVRSSGIFAVNRLEKRTIMDAAGENQEVDVVILANGLQAQDLLVPVEVRGQQGRALHEEWQSRGDAEVYMEDASITAMPTLEAETQFNVSIQERLKALVYAIRVRAWYVNSSIGKNTLIWPGTLA